MHLRVLFGPDVKIPVAMTDKEVRGIVFRGVERSKNPSLSEDGGALEVFNLRPVKDGLELVHPKEVVRKFIIGGSSGVEGKALTSVYSHSALPDGYYLVVFGKRIVLVVQGDGVMKNEDGSVFRMEYGEDITGMGELNNVLVVRTESKQDFWLWHDGKYTRMPPVRMPREMILEQAFDGTAPTSVNDRPFFGAVTGFKVPENPDTFDKDYESNRDSALRYVQGLRAEEESQQRKLGKFIGHVLVRCAFKTAQDNYISYGPVVHAEIGSYAQCTKASRFPNSADEDGKMEWYQRVYGKLIDDEKGSGKDIYPPDGKDQEEINSFWPISALRNTDTPQVEHPVFTISHNGSLPNAGFSQPPVFVGAIPYSVYKHGVFRKGEERIKESYVTPEGVELNNVTCIVEGKESGLRKLINKEIRPMAIGVYAPGIIYSYPILKIWFDKETVDALRYYKENNIIQSFCVAMTAPVKHGSGTNLVKVNTIPYEEFEKMPVFHWDDDGNRVYPSPLMQNSLLFPLKPDGNSEDLKNDDYIDVYGYPRNIDTDPERLMDRNFYLVKDISLEELLADVKEGDVYEIPLQLKDIGVVERRLDDGSVEITITEDSVSNAQREQVDPDYVSLSNIENAKSLPTDNFSCHAFLGGSYLEYNRRLHLFGVDTVLFEGYSPSPGIQRDQTGYGRNGVTGVTENMYWEAVINDGKKDLVARFPLQRYSYKNDRRYDMILPDIITYPDYRCKMMRLVLHKNGNWYNVSGDLECKNSVLNNLAYVAFTSKDIEEVASKAGLRLSCSHGLTVENRIGLDDCTPYPSNEMEEVPLPGGGTALVYIRKYSTVFLVKTAYVLKERTQSIDIGKYGYAYAPDDTLAYHDRVVDVGKDLSEYPVIDYAGMEVGGVIEEHNRVQVSATDDIFHYPSVNSYRIGSLKNRIIAASSVYGQVTEQKFGMFPLYVFSKEGIFLMEQGTGDILYSNMPKVNDDMLTGRWSLCQTGDAIAYVVRDGIRLIRGRESIRVGERADGEVCIKMPSFQSAFCEVVSGFSDLVSLVGFNEEIQDSDLFYDSYEHEILLLCPKAPLRDRVVLWSLNTDTGQLYKRVDSYKDIPSCGVVRNEKGIVWSDSMDFTGAHVLKLYDFGTSDQEYGEDDTKDVSEFLYVSNPVRMGSGTYKRIEHSVMRFYGSGIESLEVLYFGSLDCVKWFRMGGGRVSSVKEMIDFTMRRMPCSVRYFIVAIRGRAGHVQIQRLDAEIRAKYAGRLR